MWKSTSSFVAVFWLLFLIVICEGELQVLPVKNHASLCIGDSVSLEVEITGAQGQPNVQWSHGQSLLDDSEHYSSNSIGTVLDISNALPLHAGTYYATVTDGVSSEHAFFNVEVHDTYLRTLIKSPLIIQLGGTGVLKVEKSDGGILWWIHQGDIVRGQNSHYKFLDTLGSTGTELEISNAGVEQAGFYEVVLKEAGCEIRNVFDVQIEVPEEEEEEEISVASNTTEPAKLWGIIDYKYLKVFSGDFTGEWYVVPSILGPIVILLLVFIVCLIRRAATKKRPKKEKSEVKKEPKVTTHVVIEKPVYTVQKQVLDPVYYPTTDPVFDIAPVTSSHPQSSSLGAYGDMSMYGNGMSAYGTMLGAPVPPPTPELNRTYSASSDLEFLSDGGDD